MERLIKIIDSGNPRYTLEPSHIVLGRMYDHDSEELVVEIPKSESESVCTLIIADTNKTPLYSVEIKDGRYKIPSIISQYHRVLLAFSFTRNDGYVKGSEIAVGDFDLGYFSKDIDNKFNEQLSKSLAEYLTEHGVNTQIIDNDLIVDGMYKCGSFSSRRFGDLIYSAFHVSINVDLQMIRDICVKEMSLSKIPKGLSEYGITTEKIKSFVEDFIKKYE